MYDIPLQLFVGQNILIPTLIMFGAALLLGVLIVIVSNIFQVPSSETKDALMDALPGANCGGCGFPGCEGYADYLLTPGADTTLCTPGGADCAREIAQILGAEIVEPEKKIVVLHCQGTQEHTAPRYEYLGTQSCHSAHNILGGPGSCTYGCLGFGDCVAVCAFDALCLKDGIAHVNRDKCTACGQCVRACPKGLLTLLPAKASVVVRCKNEWPGAQTRKHCTIGCIGCRRCVKECPVDAISMNGSLAVIDQALCIHCGACVGVCPTKAIAQFS